MERDGISRISLCLEQKWRAFEKAARPDFKQEDEDDDEIGQDLLIRDKITAESNPADINPRNQTPSFDIPISEKPNKNSLFLFFDNKTETATTTKSENLVTK